MTRTDLWSWFTDLIGAYADALGDDDLNPFLSSMQITPLGHIRDPSFAETLSALLPESGFTTSQALEQLARFTEHEILGWWHIRAGRRIADDLRCASRSIEATPEPLRSALSRLPSP
jgi:hypothetical protein